MAVIRSTTRLNSAAQQGLAAARLADTYQRMFDDLARYLNGPYNTGHEDPVHRAAIGHLSSMLWRKKAEAWANFVMFSQIVSPADGREAARIMAKEVLSNIGMPRYHNPSISHFLEKGFGSSLSKEDERIFRCEIEKGMKILEHDAQVKDDDRRKKDDAERHQEQAQKQGKKRAAALKRRKAKS